MSSKDWWCPNCKQMVRPKEDRITYIITFTLLTAVLQFVLEWLSGLTGWFYWGVTLPVVGYLTRTSFAAWTSLILVLPLALLGWNQAVVRSCPMCKTHNVTRQIPGKVSKTSKNRS